MFDHHIWLIEALLLCFWWRSLFQAQAICVWVFASVHICVCLWVCRCMCAMLSVHMCMCACVWKPEGIPGCCSPGAVHIFCLFVLFCFECVSVYNMFIYVWMFMPPSYAWRSEDHLRCLFSPCALFGVGSVNCSPLWAGDFGALSCLCLPPCCRCNRITEEEYHTRFTWALGSPHLYSKCLTQNPALSFF